MSGNRKSDPDNLTKSEKNSTSIQSDIDNIMKSRKKLKRKSGDNTVSAFVVSYSALICICFIFAKF